MLRFILIALVVANLGYFVVSRGEANGPGEREPQRLAQQIRPQMLQIRKPDAVAQPADPTPQSVVVPVEAPRVRTDGDPSP